MRTDDSTEGPTVILNSRTVMKVAEASASCVVVCCRRSTGYYIAPVVAEEHVCAFQDFTVTERKMICKCGFISRKGK